MFCSVKCIWILSQCVEVNKIFLAVSFVLKQISPSAIASKLSNSVTTYSRRGVARFPVFMSGIGGSVCLNRSP